MINKKLKLKLKFKDMFAKQVEEFIFDSDRERELTMELKRVERDIYVKHITYDRLIDFYYDYKDNLDCRQHCIDYCKTQIKDLDNWQRANYEYKAKKIKNNKKLSPDDIKFELSYIKPNPKKINSFDILIELYDDNCEYKNASIVCDKAVAYYKKYGLKSYIDYYINLEQKLIKLYVKRKVRR